METPIPVDLGRIAQDLQIRRVQVESVVQLLDEGNTVPFITRYRKERTGGLNEVVIREIQARVTRLRELAERKETILRAIEAQGKLSEDLAAAIRAADNPKRLEDLYLPFKPKKKTKASEAREKGFEPLALRIWNRDESLTDLAAACAGFLSEEKGITTIEEVLAGVGHILSESINELAPVREAVRRIVWKLGKIATSKAENVPEGQGLDFRDYFSYTEPINHIPPHRVLALNRGEKENTIKVKLDVPRPELERALFSQMPIEGHPHQEFFTRAALDALDRLLLPSLEREVRRDLTEMAERHAVDVFARNLRSLLLQPPIQKQTVLAIDPGFRTGCKVAVLDAFGNLLAHEIIHPHQPQNRRAEAKVKLKEMVGKHQVGVIAIGNGTACRETEEFVAEIIAEGTYFHTHPDETSLPGQKPEPATQVTPQVEPEPDAQHFTPMAQTDQAEAQGPSDADLAQPTSTPEPAAEPPGVTESTPQVEPEPDAQHDTSMGQTDDAEAPGQDGVETLPPIAGGAPEGDETTATEPAVAPPAASEETASTDADTPVPAPEPTPATPDAHLPVPPPEAAPEPLTPVASEPVTPDAHEPVPPAPAAEGGPGAEEAPAPETPAPAAPETTPEEEIVQPIAADFTHLPVGPKPKAEAREPREPRPRPPKAPKQPPPPPAPHPADAQLALLAYVIVNEAGASVYSTSPVGRDEFPDLDATTRSAVSIGRRLQDPLAELVKIEPQNIGVGLYQHDVSPKQLKESLEQVIESCVNFVGVDLNSASISLLRHVSGLNALTAKRLFEFRQEHGPFTGREQIQQVEGVGPVTFTQAAGFLKIRDQAHPFDRTWIHPESYEAAAKLLAALGFAAEDVLDKEKLPEIQAKLHELDLPAQAHELEIGEPTLYDICEALARPDRDPREDLPTPIFKKGVLKLEDLIPNMELKGTVLNVVDFGAFVDIGLKDSGLVHISQLANRYVKSPHDVVSVGDVVTVWVLSVDSEAQAGVADDGAARDRAAPGRPGWWWRRPSGRRRTGGPVRAGRSDGWSRSGGRASWRAPRWTAARWPSGRWRPAPPGRPRRERRHGRSARRR